MEETYSKASLESKLKDLETTLKTLQELADNQALLYTALSEKIYANQLQQIQIKQKIGENK